MKGFIRLTAVAAFVLLVQGCASGGGPSTGASVTRVGTVTALNPSPMYSDSDGVIVIRTEEHGIVTVRVPARFDRCQATGLATIHVLGLGDRVRAVGVLTEPSVLRVCEGSDHVLERGGL